MYKIDFHADDYGISPNNSKRILELVRNGHLNSFSIIPNMSCYDECISILKAEWDSLPVKPLISVHINLIGGINLSNTGNQYPSWGKIFLPSLIPGKNRKRMFSQITSEIESQISRVYNDISSLDSSLKLRLDSHVHTHMIPLVFDATIQAVENLGLTDRLEYIRLSREPLGMFLTTKGVRGTYSPVNIVKNLVLRFLSLRSSRILAKKHINHGLLWGLMMSGKMDKDRMSILLPQMTAYTQKKDTYLEILGHPGIVLPEESLPEFGPDDTVAFFSENRNLEYQAMEHCCPLSSL